MWTWAGAIMEANVGPKRHNILQEMRAHLLLAQCMPVQSTGGVFMPPLLVCRRRLARAEYAQACVGMVYCL